MPIGFATLLLIFTALVTSSASANDRDCRAFESPAQTSRAKIGPLKFYLTINLTFPQSIDVITLALTAARILDLDAWETFHSLPEPDAKTAWSAMTRAHRAHGIGAEINQKRVELLLHEFVYRASYAEMTVSELLQYISRGGGNTADRKREYSEALLKLLKSQTILDYGKAIREAASQSDNEYLIRNVEAIKVELRLQLESRFPELAVPFSKWRPQYRRVSRDHTTAKLLIEAFAFNLEPEVYGR